MTENQLTQEEMAQLPDPSRNHLIGQPLSKARATALDKKIRTEAGKARTAVEQVSILLEEAKRGKVHTTLGFKAWPAYVKDVLSGQVNIPDIQSRRVLVALMTGEGMSQKDIAAALGITRGSVRLDQQRGQISHPDKPVTSNDVESPKSEAPAKVVASDGKTYTDIKGKPRPTKEQQAEAASKIRKELADAGVKPPQPVQPRDKSALEITLEVCAERAEREQRLEVIRDDAELVLKDIQDWATDNENDDRYDIDERERKVMQDISTHLTNAQWAISELMGTLERLETE